MVPSHVWALVEKYWLVRQREELPASQEKTKV
jgi:hypothetical protein